VSKDLGKDARQPDARPSLSPWPKLRMTTIAAALVASRSASDKPEKTVSDLTIVSSASPLDQMRIVL